MHRGNAMPALRGRHSLPDRAAPLRSFAFDAAAEQLDCITIPGSVFSFGVDAQGEIYVLADPTTVSQRQGTVHRSVTLILSIARAR
ncbi:hypothetical protein ACTMU2_40140, partial [Cupriavidus basilensis]